MLEVVGLVSGYGHLTVLQGVDLNVDAGETVCVLGPNGCGKSTLLKTIVGLVEPRRGLVQFEGRDVTGVVPERLVGRGLALVPPGGRTVRSLTVRENLLLGALRRGRRHARSVAAQDLQQIMEVLPSIRDTLDVPAGRLSGGEQQVVSIGRALMSKPHLLMLDEPTLGLSPIASERLFHLLEGLRRLELTMLLVEQNTGLALEFADRGYILDQGVVAVEGATDKLSQDERVRDVFLGSQRPQRPGSSAPRR